MRSSPSFKTIHPCFISLNCDKSNPRNILTNIPGFLVILVSDAAFSIEKLFAICTLSIKLIFYLAWMYEKGCASKPKKKSLQVNPKYNFNGHEGVLKN